MSKSKELRISIRFSEEEAERLEEKAKDHCMTLSQYIRYKADDEGVPKKSKQPYCIEFLDKNLPMITRVILDGYFHIRALARQKLDDKDYEEIGKETHIEFKKMGILKEGIVLKDDRKGSMDDKANRNKWGCKGWQGQGKRLY